jgi:hypothetical protein
MGAKEAAPTADLHKNQSALLQASKAAPAEAATAIREIAGRKAVKPAPAPLNDIETKEQWKTAFMRVWNRGAQEWRDEVQSPVFDNTRAG